MSEADLSEFEKLNLAQPSRDSSPPRTQGEEYPDQQEHGDQQRDAGGGDLDREKIKRADSGEGGEQEKQNTCGGHPGNVGRFSRRATRYGATIATKSSRKSGMGRFS